MKMALCKNMRIMRLMRLIRGLGGMNLFYKGNPHSGDWATLTKQILGRAFWQKCLILPHFPHEWVSCPTIKTKNMRIMRIHEGVLFIGFYLPCIEIGIGSRPKHEAVMRLHEGHPHVLAGRIA